MIFKRRPRYLGRRRPEKIDISITVELTEEIIGSMSRSETIDRLIDAYWISQSTNCDLSEDDKRWLSELTVDGVRQISIDDLRMRLVRTVEVLNTSGWIADMRFAFRDY